MQNNLQQAYGNIDIYLFDQLLKGRYDNCKKVLDAGCGNGAIWFTFYVTGTRSLGLTRNHTPLMQ